jgi:hypothetical protein
VPSSADAPFLPLGLSRKRHILAQMVLIYRLSAVVTGRVVVGDTQQCRFWATQRAPNCSAVTRTAPSTPVCDLASSIKAYDLPTKASFSGFLDGHSISGMAFALRMAKPRHVAGQ